MRQPLKDHKFMRKLTLKLSSGDGDLIIVGGEEGGEGEGKVRVDRIRNIFRKLKWEIYV
jgi:hypothetical protein